MVARRRLTSSPSSESSNEEHMAVDIPRRVPLHVGVVVSDDDDGNDHQVVHEHEMWDDSPVRHLSHSSSSSSSWSNNNNNSPPRIAEIVEIPAALRGNGCIESQQQQGESRRRGSSSSKHATIPSPFMFGLVFIGLVATFLSRSSVSYAVQKASELSANRDKLSEKLYRTEDDLQSLRREMMAMNALIHQQKEVESHASPWEANRQLQLNELAALQARIKDLNSKGSTLRDRVQIISREEIQSKYGGPGNKYVEMELVFPDGKEGPTKFIIELASDEMPHSVHTFLEMVSTGLLDGCSFILNSMNVLKAAPLPYDGSLAAAKAKAFADHGLESVAFKEYNEKYPHEKYTIGFAADGSPSFYINTEDNTDFHFGDPCFGRIVDGLSTIKRLESAPTRNGIWFAKKIGIKHARILRGASLDGLRHGLRQKGVASSASSASSD